MPELNDGGVYYIGVRLNSNKVIEAATDGRRVFIGYHTPGTLWSYMIEH